MAWSPGGEAAGGRVQGEETDPDQRDDRRLEEEPVMLLVSPKTR